MNPAIGVDLGTTNTVVAAQVDMTGAELVDILHPNEQRNVLDSGQMVKSAVYFESVDSAVVGAFASRRMGAFRSIKSKMGTRWRVAHPYSQDQMVDPAYISGHILRVALEAVERRFPDWDRSALITVPASFNTDQRLDTLAAAKLAGFRGVRLLDEPTAAFYYYFDQQRDAMRLDHPLSVLVFDFGGGTLDVSIIQVERRGDEIVIDAIGRSRYNNLGGDDIDMDIAAFMLGCWEYELGKEVSELSIDVRRQVFQLFIERSRLFKEEVEDYLLQSLGLPEFVIYEEVLTASESLPVRLQKTLTRGQYDEITGRFMQDKQTVNIFRPIGQALAVASKIRPGFSMRSLDLILYTGGASRMSAVKAALECFFAPKKCFSLSDEEACNTVALGAACCRYDERYRGTHVRMTARMLESVLTRSDDGLTYIPLVPIDCEPSDEFIKVNHQFRTQRDLITLKLPLFLGTGANDPQLNPMRDAEFRLPHMIDRDTPYYAHYRITQDKTVQLRVDCLSQNGVITASTQLELLAGPAACAETRRLAQVNSTTGAL